MRLVIIAALITFFSVLPERIDRKISVVFVEPVGEEFTVEEQAQAVQKVIDSAEFWQGFSSLSIASTQLITTEYDVLSDPGMSLQLNNLRISAHDLPVVVIDNSNSGRYLFDKYSGLASYAAVYVLTSTNAAIYAHEFGHALYDLPHQYQEPVDIMSLDPQFAYNRHTIGCASLKVLGRECYKVYLPVAR